LHDDQARRKNYGASMKVLARKTGMHPKLGVIQPFLTMPSFSVSLLSSWGTASQLFAKLLYALEGRSSGICPSSKKLLGGQGHAWRRAAVSWSLEERETYVCFCCGSSGPSPLACLSFRVSVD